MRIALFLLVLLVGCFTANAQQRVQLSGYVNDAASGEVLIGAVVQAHGAGKAFHAVSNQFGFYSLSLPEGQYTVKASMLGYEVYTDTLALQSTRTYTFRLAVKETLLNEVVVTAPQDSAILISELNYIQLSGKTLQQVPRLAGEADVMKALQFLPGLKQGQEGNAGLHVRGGSPDQNLILLDGVPVYNVYHMFGLLSVFNTDAINDVRIYKGGISSRYEGRLSSVIDITLKEGDAYKQKRSFTLSPISGSFLWEGPVVKGKSSFIVTGRRTFLDALLAAATVRNSNKFGYGFHDFSAKFNHKFNDRSRAYASFYTSQDKFFLSYKDRDVTARGGFKWGNLTALGRHTYQVSPKIFLSNLAYYSNYTFTQDHRYTKEADSQSHIVSSRIEDVTLRTMAEYFPGNRHKLLGGAEFGHRNFRPEVTRITQGEQERYVNAANPARTHTISVFAEDNISWDKLQLLLSARQSVYIIEGKGRVNFQPHALLSYKLRPNLNLKGSYDRMAQYLHLLTNSTLGQPTDLWVPATNRIAPQLSQQVAAGIDYKLLPNLFIGIEGYVKEMRNVVEYKEGANYAFGNEHNWDEKVTTGRGQAAGVEVLVRKEGRKLHGWVAYTLAKSTRHFADINGGLPFPYRYDRTHDASVVGMYNVNAKNQFSATFTYNTGNAFTMPIAKAALPNMPFFEISPYKDYAGHDVITGRNNFRMPAYHRMDLSYQHTKKLPRDRARTWILCVYNVYNRLNPFMLYEVRGSIRQVALFPILPSVAYKLDF
jgi:outer membrane cobalamin receptor